MNTDEFARKFNVYNLNYVENPQFWLGTNIVGKSIVNNEETFISEINVDPNDPDIELLLYGLFTNQLLDSKTVGIDYRLITRDFINVIINLYAMGRLNGIRILPSGKRLTRDIFDVLNVPELSGLLVSADGVASDVDLSTSNLDFHNQNGIAQIERVVYTKNVSGNLVTTDNTNVHIRRELSDEEIRYIADLLKTNRYNNLIVDFYEPTYYLHLLDVLSNLSIPNNISIRFLANPLYDKYELYENLINRISNPVIVKYNTCNDLNGYYKNEDFCSEGVNYYSDIESSGITDLDTYARMVKMIDEVVRHMEQMNYSPLERVAYLYDYFKEHYIYDPDFQSTPHSLNADLDKIFSRDRMICEGFSNLFSAILRRAGIMCFTYGTDDHQKNIIRITDDKYKIDRIALLDSTNDLHSRNAFYYFLNPITNDLNSSYPEVINIPTSFCMSQQDYDDNILDSNPVYATDAFGYGIRMLELMGLRLDQSNFTRREDYDLYRDALSNSGLMERLSEDTLTDAIIYVRNTEGRYYGESDRNIDRDDVHDNVSDRGENSNYPSIRRFDGSYVPINIYRPKTNTTFEVIDSQNMSLTYPRDKRSNETDEEYFNYLHDFYYSRFIGRDDVVTVEEDVVVNTNNDSNQNSNTVVDTNSTPEVDIPNNTVDTPVQSENVSNNTVNTSNESNVNNNNHVPYTNSKEYIPGTNILKPRDRDYLETDEEYEAYLKEYYDYFFPNTSTNNTVVEDIDLYINEDNNLYYVTDEVVEIFGLHSAAYPGVINGVHCYRITSEDVEKLIRDVNNSNNRYRIRKRSFARMYERNDDAYQSFDRRRR